MGAVAAVPPAEERYLVTYRMSRGRITCTVAVWHLGLTGCWETERDREGEREREEREREREERETEREKGRERERKGERGR